MVLPEPDNKEEQHKIKLRKIFLQLTGKRPGFYTALAGKNGSRAQQYLYSRGIGIQTIKRFGLGFALDDWSALSKALMAKGYGEDILISSGESKKQNSKLNDRFRNRIMFPIFDLRGNVVAFGGRVMDDTLPKYINSQKHFATARKGTIRNASCKEEP